MKCHKRRRHETGCELQSSMARARMGSRRATLFQLCTVAAPVLHGHVFVLLRSAPHGDR